MKPVTIDDLKTLYLPPSDSHKGQNGKLLVIGGSHLFHAASLWALEVASRIVDLVHYSSVPENNELVQKIKSEFHNGIVVPRSDLDAYIEEDDVVLIGPGMTRDDETKELTDRLLKKYPHKQWVIDAGALQMMDVSLIPHNAILTPHHGEFAGVFGGELHAGPEVGSDEASGDENFLDPLLASPSKHGTQGVLASKSIIDPPDLKLGKRSSKILFPSAVEAIAKKYHCIVLLKGPTDIACPAERDSASQDSPNECRIIEGGNAGMTKGGTGDVLAGLIAALACKNNPFSATIAGSFINKKAGEALYGRVGPFFNASDLAKQIPVTMKELFV